MIKLLIIILPAFVLRPIIRDDTEYFITYFMYGAIMGVISGLLKSREEQ